MTVSKVVGAEIKLDTWEGSKKYIIWRFWTKALGIAFSKFQKHLGTPVRKTCEVSIMEQTEKIEYFLDSIVAAYAGGGAIEMGYSGDEGKTFWTASVWDAGTI